MALFTLSGDGGDASAALTASATACFLSRGFAEAFSLRRKDLNLVDVTMVCYTWLRVKGASICIDSSVSLSLDNGMWSNRACDSQSQPSQRE